MNKNEIYVDGKIINTRCKKSKKKTPLDWRDTLKMYDVLITKNGDLRVVREATYSIDGFLSSVQLVARKCNRFNSGLVSYFRADLRRLNMKKAEVKLRPKLEDLELTNHLLYDDFWQIYGWNKKYTCQSVKNFAQGETMKDFLLGMVAGVLAFGIPAIVYVLRTGGIS